MPIKITNHPPRTRCYKCGSTDIETVCHHCRRAMCAEHTRRVVDAQGRLLSVEFTGLGLKNTSCGEVPVHCEHCYHIVHPPQMALTIVGIAIFFLVLVLPFDTSARFIGILLGGGMAGLGFYINKRRAENLIQSKPSLPFLARFNTIQIREIVRSKINLDSKGDYHVSIPSAVGVLSITSNFGKPERDQLEQYRKRYRLGENQDLQFNAGFITLRSSSGLEFSNATPEDNNTVFVLTDQVRSQSSLMSIEDHEAGEWHKSKRYNLLNTMTDKHLPIRIVPSLIQEAAQRALDLEIQWTERDPTTQGLTIHRIDQLNLQVPVTWGEVEQVTDSAIIGQSDNFEGGDPVRTITWRGLPITNSERKNHHRTFSIRFEDVIDVNGSIQGRLEITFKGTLSGTEDVYLFYPLGNRREADSLDISTQLLIDFELSLAGLRYQDIRVVPDPKKDKDKPETLIFEDVIPDHNTVIALTNAISEDFYIKRIIENPPRTGEQASLVNRYWDIAGRHYLGVYPIDYHLIVSGEAIYGGEFRARAGTTKTTLTVQGAYANENMEIQIENVWERLNHLISTTLEQLPRAKPSVYHDNTKISQPTLSQKSTSATNVDDQVERINALRKRLDDLFEMLTMGRLSEETFLKLKSETEKELQLLQPKT